MSDRKYRIMIDGLGYEVEASWILREYPIEKAIDAVMKNSPIVKNFLKSQKWTLVFLEFRNDGAEADNIDKMFFTVDFDEKKIYFNMLGIARHDLVEHYILYASMFVFDSAFNFKISESTLFLGAMALDAKIFTEMMKDEVEKQIGIFLDCQVEDEDFFDILRFEYLTPRKYLYAAYAKLCLEPDEMHNNCVYTTDYFRGEFW